MVPRIMIAGTGSGSGKTLITCGLLRLLAGMGKRTAAFKCGPDYIDPMFHREILGVPSKNLDLFFTGEELTKSLFLEDAAAKDISVTEGVMGLYDGLAGLREEASSYHLAKALRMPVVLTVDAHGMGRSLLPLLAGFLQFDTHRLIQGVILNRMNGSFYTMIKPEIEKNLGVPVLGYLPKTEEIKLESRHLGLKLPGEAKNLQKQAEAAANLLARTVDIRRLVRIAKEAGELRGLPVAAMAQAPLERYGKKGRIPVGVALDEAFCFYYEDNLRLLRRMGAEPVFFSPLRDLSLPAGSCGLVLGGGYPELYAGELSENASMRASVSEALSKGMPSIAECGGFMYLHEQITDLEGEAFSMTGTVKGSCRYTGRPVRFGYAEYSERKSGFLRPGETVRGHEFHYFESTNNGEDCLAEKPVTGKSFPCVHKGENHWWGFPHLYYYSNPRFAEYFMERVFAYEKTSGFNR